MKKMSHHASLFLLAAGLLTGATAWAHNGEDHGQHAAPAADHPSAQTPADGKRDYPLETCVVSGDKLEDGDMGPPIDYVYKEAGKPDRLVRFCCKQCIKTFKKDPAKYLKIIDDAAAKKTSGHDAHAGHMH